SFRPRWVDVSQASLKKDYAAIHYCMINDLPSLIWVANLASLELHTLLSKGDELKKPTMVVFDLDPGPGSSILQCAWAAQQMKRLLKELRLECFAKVSGSKGLHLAAPLNTPVDFDATKAFARGVAEAFERQFPD